MTRGKTLTLLLLPAAALAWQGYGAWVQAGIPRVELREVTPLAAAGDRALPFFELMSPVPALDGHRLVPKLEYKKGPPDRFLERITLLVQADPNAPKERIVYHGRRSRTDLAGISLFPDEPAREARYLEAALRLSQGEEVPAVSGVRGFLFRPFLLREAARWLTAGSPVETVSIMDQAGTPAFLFECAPGESGRARATAVFARRNAFYRVDYVADKAFALVDPASLFRRSFLTEKRADAMGYLAQNLSEVKMEKPAGRLAEIAWPVLLLAANVSVDPSSIDSYFHFAGLNALLYRGSAGDGADLEISDVFRNNVLAADSYARDVAPEASKTAEIGRLARLLTRNFEQ